MKRPQRSVVAGAGIALIALTACTSSPTDPTDADGSTSETDETTQTPGTTTLDILSWWTAGGEAEALQAVVDGFTAENNTIQIENSAVAGGAGANSQAVLSTRLQGGDPPGVFQAQGGADLLRWQEAGYLADMTHLFEANDWISVMPEEVIEMNSVDGQIYGLPINIHRNNNIWYNKQIFDDNGLEPPTTFDELIAVANELQALDIVPLALGSQTPRWSTLVFEHILVAEIGVDAAHELWAGNGNFDSPEVREALSKFDQILEYTNDNHSALDWQEAADLLIAGDAAMHIMGDWETGYFETHGWTAGVEYDWVQFPNAEEVFSIVNDSLAIPEEYGDKETAELFIEYFGSVDGQHDFNIIKGSIPARTDVDTSDYSDYSISAAEDFTTAKIYIGLASGSATSAGFIGRVDDIITQFVSGRDVDIAINGFVDAQSLLGSF